MYSITDVGDMILVIISLMMGMGIVISKNKKKYKTFCKENKMFGEWNTLMCIGILIISVYMGLTPIPCHLLLRSRFGIISFLLYYLGINR